MHEKEKQEKQQEETRAHQRAGGRRATSLAGSSQCPGRWAHMLSRLTHSSYAVREAPGITPFKQMRPTRPREVMPLAEGPLARKWPSRDELSPDPAFLTAGLGGLSGSVRETRGVPREQAYQGHLPTVGVDTTPTRLRRDTARETHVLKSSGFFLQRQVMRLTAAVTTP